MGSKQFGDQVEKAKDTSKGEELSGKLKFDNLDDKLMHSVLEHDKEAIDEGKIMNDALDNSLNSFAPDLMFEQMVKNFSMAKKIMGPKIIRQLAGYNEDYIEKNINIPEFQRELKKKIEEKIKNLKKKNLLDKDNMITSKGIELAKLVMYVEELDRISPKGFAGEKEHKKKSNYGEKFDIKYYSKGDRFRDICVQKTVKTAIRRNHSDLHIEDIKVHTRKAKGKINIIYALDASGSMKGDKIGSCKKAGIALCFKAIEKKDQVGLIVFGENVEQKVNPTNNFNKLLNQIIKIKAASQTNLAKTIMEAITMFPKGNITKHLVLLTDAMPTAGDDPKRETIEAASLARANDITISIVGIKLTEDGIDLAKQIIEIGRGKFHLAHDLDEIDRIVLSDYNSIADRY